MAIDAPAASGQAGTAPTVVKLGGDVLAGAALTAVARDLEAVWQTGRRVMVVHGGGVQATELSQRLGLTPHLVGGRRITDPPTLDVIKMVVAGRLNVDLVAALRSVGVPAVGLSGTSGIVEARRRSPTLVTGGGDSPVDFGLVGDVRTFDLRLPTLLWEAGLWPVLACLGLTPQGEVLNINADIVASHVAAALGAAVLVAVTGVGGVRRDRADPATRIPKLTVAEATAAIAAGVVQGGMLPKLQEAFVPLAAGVASVQILAPGEIAAGLRAPGSVGTLLVR